jgi:hypothetical protein
MKLAANTCLLREIRIVTLTACTADTKDPLLLIEGPWADTRRAQFGSGLLNNLRHRNGQDTADS